MFVLSVRAAFKKTQITRRVADFYILRVPAHMADTRIVHLYSLPTPRGSAKRKESIRILSLGMRMPPKA